MGRYATQNSGKAGSEAARESIGG